MHEDEGEPVDPEPVDLVVRRRVRLRLEGAGPAAVDAVIRQLHAARAPARAPVPPDLLVRWVDELPGDGPTVRAGPDAGARGDTFFVRGTARGPWATLPFGAQLRGATMTVGQGARDVPLLDSLAHVLALEQGAFPLHGVVVRHHDRGIAVTGWSRSGKTAALLGLLAGGAVPVATEWAYPDAGRWYGDDAPARLKPHHLADLPDGLTLPPARARASLRARRAVSKAVNRLDHGAAAAVARRLDARAHVDAAMTNRADDAPLGELYLLLRTDRGDVRTRPLPPAEAAARLRQSLLEDLAPLTTAHRRFRYLCPTAPTGPIDRLVGLVDASVDSLLGSVDLQLLEAPYPPDPGELAAVMLGGGPSTATAPIR